MLKIINYEMRLECVNCAFEEIKGARSADDLAREQGQKARWELLHPVRLLRVWVSEGLTQADS